MTLIFTTSPDIKKKEKKGVKAESALTIQYTPILNVKKIIGRNPRFLPRMVSFSLYFGTTLMG